MSFGQNLQYLRKMQNGMTQEALADKMDVTRQTVSKWELESAFPEMDKALLLCKLFHCTLDELMLGSINLDNAAYNNFRVESVPAFRYYKYAVISMEPEEDARRHVLGWAAAANIQKPVIIGWDFPFLSQEQVNVFHMHGYVAACILPEGFIVKSGDVTAQASQNYAVITIREPFANAFVLIPNAYKALMRYMDVNSLRHQKSKDVLACFEKEYKTDGVTYMDVLIAVET